MTDKTRYNTLIERTQWWGRNMMIWGIHVHIGVDDVNKVLPIVNALAVYLPHLQALSASSPFWAGERTGYALEPFARFLSSCRPRGSPGPSRTGPSTSPTSRTWSPPV